MFVFLQYLKVRWMDGWMRMDKKENQKRSTGRQEPSPPKEEATQNAPLIEIKAFDTAPGTSVR
jgi:hypothetical protein